MKRLRMQTGEEVYLQACDLALEMGKELTEEMAVYVQGKAHYLTRYANNQVIQHVRKHERQLIVQVIVDGKSGMASCNQFDEDSLRRTVEQAVELSRHSEVDPNFQGFARPEEIPTVRSYDEETGQVTPQEMAEAVKVITDQAVQYGLESAGACQITLLEKAVANSRGVRVYEKQSSAGIHAVVMSETGSGYATDTHQSFRKLNPAEVAQVAIAKCIASIDPQPIDIGTYPVILESAAVSSLLAYLAYAGINPESYHRGFSFLSGRMGEQIFDSRIMITSDPLNEEGLPSAFDWDGKARQRVPLFTDGVATGMLYDDYHGKKYGAVSTGNALFPTDRSYGVLPEQLSMAAGDTSMAEMLKKIGRGILVTRFHYLGVVDAKNTVVTGMTRDGTFLVENGKIVAPLKNLRMTQSIEKAFNQILAVGDEAKNFMVWDGFVRTPALMIDGFNFTGVTEH